MKKIAVVNRTNLKNYGSVLQCYALCEAVKMLGYDAEIIWETGNVSSNYDFRLLKVIKTGLRLLLHPSLCLSTFKGVHEIQNKEISKEKIEKFNNFVELHISQKLYSHKDLIRIANSREYDKFICGSDQVWCSTTLYVDPLMYLRFAPKEKRIAYAPSIGRDFIPHYNKRLMRKYIEEIPCVSIREVDGQKLIKELTGMTVPIVADPTLLIERTQWDRVKSKTKEQSYVLLYFLDEPSVDVQKQISDFAKKNGLSIISIGNKLSMIENVCECVCGPSEFIGFIENSELVITDSYHGMLFSIIYEKNFWAIERNYVTFDQSSRQLTLLDKINLRERYVRNCEDISNEPIDYVNVKKILDDYKSYSLNYLKESIIMD